MTFTDAPSLPDWIAQQYPFRRRMLQRADGTSIHFVDEGEGPAVVLFHGNPMWGYLWRKVVRALHGSNLRVIVPDLLGCGLSTKLRHPREHQLLTHIDAIVDLVDALELPEFVIAGQDWGGPVAAGVAWKRPDRIRGALFANTAVISPKRPFRSKAFHRFSHMRGVSDLVFRGFGFPLQTLQFAQGDRASLGRAERAAYKWPFRRFADRAAPLGLARMVPNAEDHPTTAVLDAIDAEWVRPFNKPVRMVWGMSDPILGRAGRRMQRAFPQAPMLETRAGHFLQEEVPELLAEALRDLS